MVADQQADRPVVALNIFQSIEMCVIFLLSYITYEINPTWAQSFMQQSGLNLTSHMTHC